MKNMEIVMRQTNETMLQSVGSKVGADRVSNILTVTFQCACITNTKV